MQQAVPNAVCVNTATYPLFVPQMVHESEDDDAVFQFLVTAWVFTAWLAKRFPKADIAMIAGMSAFRSPDELLELGKLMLERFPDHPKSQLNIDMLRCLKETFLAEGDVSKEAFAEAAAYNAAAVEEINALFPCVCGECPTDKKN